MSSHSVQTCTQLGCHDGRYLSRDHLCVCAEIAWADTTAALEVLARLSERSTNGRLRDSIAAVRSALWDGLDGEVGTGAGEGATGQDTGTARVTRSVDCPEAPAQAHLPASVGEQRAEWRRRIEDLTYSDAEVADWCLQLLDEAEHDRTGWTLYSELVDRHNTERLHLGSVIAELKSLLRRACEDNAREDCTFDHHGDCQMHGPWGDGEPCPYPLIRQYLEAPS